MSENVSIREIAWRQYNVGRPASFFIRIVGMLDLYELPPFTEVMNGISFFFRFSVSRPYSNLGIT
jgi:hypothetical protein